MQNQNRLNIWTEISVHIRCGYKEQIYRGKWPFYHGKLAWSARLDFSEIKYPWLRQKEKETGHGI